MSDAARGAALPASSVIEVYVDAPAAFFPRAVWTLTTLLAPLGRRPRPTQDPERAANAALAYARAPVPGVPTLPCSTKAMDLLAAGEPLAPGAFARPASGDEPCGGDSLVAAFPVPGSGFAASCDLVASAFVLLACWDERTTPERDRFDRLPYAASVFASNPELHIDVPVVDGYVEALRDMLAPRLAVLGLEPLPAPGWMWGEDRFALALTHDIDNLWRWTPRGFAATGYRGARALRRRDGAALRRELGDLWDWLTRHLPRRSDPFWTFPQMIAGEDARGVSSTFFVIASHTHRRDGNQPRVYAKRIPEVLAMLRAGDREVGLHGNDADRLDGAALRRDRDGLAARVGGPVDGIRYHYLRCLYHETLPLLEEIGFAYDSSLAFAEREGFRCGASFPFHPYDLTAERPLELLEVPLALMDTGLQGGQYRALDAPTAERVAREVLGRAREGGGGVAVLWHNLRFDPRAARGYDDVYWRLVDWARTEGAFVAPAGEIARRWTAATEGGAP